MKILMTGGTGFVGSHTAAALSRAGHDVRLLVRDEAKARRVFAALEAELPETVVGDVTDADATDSALSGCDGVLHAAALVALDARRAEAADRTNFEGTRNVLGAAARRGIPHRVYVSSVSALFDPGAGPIGPHSSPAALGGSGYSASKARCELWVRERQSEGEPIASTYPSAVLGPVAPSLTAAHRSLPLQLRVALLTEGGLNYVDVRDLAAIHVALFARPAAPGRWLAGGAFLSFPDLADLMDELTGRRIPRVRVPGAILRGLGRVGDLVHRAMPFDFPLTYEAMTTATRWPGVDSSRTIRELGVGFRPARETLADTLAWLHRTGHVDGGALGALARPPA